MFSTVININFKISTGSYYTTLTTKNFDIFSTQDFIKFIQRIAGKLKIWSMRNLVNCRINVQTKHF